MTAPTTRTDHAAARSRGQLALSMHQFRFDLAAFARNGQSRFFTLALPVIFLVIFASIFNGTVKVPGGMLKTSVFYVPGIITLGIIAAVVYQPGHLDNGTARDWRAQAAPGDTSPGPASIAGRSLTSTVVALFITGGTAPHRLGLLPRQRSGPDGADPGPSRSLSVPSRSDASATGWRR